MASISPRGKTDGRIPVVEVKLRRRTLVLLRPHGKPALAKALVTIINIQIKPGLKAKLSLISDSFLKIYIYNQVIPR